MSNRKIVPQPAVQQPNAQQQLAQALAGVPEEKLAILLSLMESKKDTMVADEEKSKANVSGASSTAQTQRNTRKRKRSESIAKQLAMLRERPQDEDDEFFSELADQILLNEDFAHICWNINPKKNYERCLNPHSDTHPDIYSEDDPDIEFRFCTFHMTKFEPNDDDYAELDPRAQHLLLNQILRAYRRLHPAPAQVPVAPAPAPGPQAPPAPVAPVVSSAPKKVQPNDEELTDPMIEESLPVARPASRPASRPRSSSVSKVASAINTLIGYQQ